MALLKRRVSRVALNTALQTKNNPTSARLPHTPSHDRASAYTPPSRAPADIAARLEAYIARHERHARDHVDDTGDTPKIQRGFMDGLFLHIRRLEHQMRCFILFLAAELIARGLVKPQPLALRPRREADPAAPSAEIRREDRQLRLALSGQVRLNTFSITTPVVEGKPGRKPRKKKTATKKIEKKKRAKKKKGTKKKN